MPGEIAKAPTVNYAKLIEDAITALKDIDKEMMPKKRYQGISLQSLSKYLIQNNEFEDDVKAKGKIKVATKRMLDSEKLVKTSGTGLTGKFKLSDPPKAVAKPKPTAKKTKPGPETSAEKKAKAAAKKKAPAKKNTILNKDKMEKIYEDLENGLDGSGSGSEKELTPVKKKPQKVAKKTKPPVPPKESESEHDSGEEAGSPPKLVSPPKRGKKGKAAEPESEGSDEEETPVSPPKRQKKGKAVESEESEEEPAPSPSPVKKGKKVAKKTKPPVPVSQESDDEKENSPVKAKPKGRVAKPKVTSKVVKKVPAKKAAKAAPVADLMTPPPKTALKGKPQPVMDYDLSTGTEESGTGEEYLSEEE